VRSGNLDQVFSAGMTHVVTSVGASQQDMLSIQPCLTSGERPLAHWLVFWRAFSKGTSGLWTSLDLVEERHVPLFWSRVDVKPCFWGCSMPVLKLGWNGWNPTCSSP
jgi:hypothetical protein